MRTRGKSRLRTAPVAQRRFVQSAAGGSIADRTTSSVGVDFCANGAYGEPSAYGTRDRDARSDTHQKRRISANTWKSADLSLEVRVTLLTESHLAGITHDLGVGARVAHQRAGNRRDRARCAARVATVEHQTMHLEARFTTG
jgi:hypothetical protein